MTTPTPAQVKAAVEQRYEMSRVLDEPTWNEDDQEWRALVALTPRGPLIVMRVKISAVEHEAESSKGGT